MKKQQFLCSLLTSLFISLSLQSFAASSTNSDASSDKTPALADPIPYNATADNMLGINENGKGLAPGTSIDDISISDMHGETFKLQDAWQQQPALIVFYRGGWCPFCNMQVREMAVNYDKFKSADVQPILISVDAPDKTAMMTAQYTIPFPVLSDPDLLAHNAFNVVLTLDEATLERHKQYGFSLQDWSGKNHNSIAVASAFIIDRNGKVLVSHAPEDYRTRPSIEQLLQLIAEHTQ